MVKYLFPEFLSDSGQYSEAEKTWRCAWEELVRRSDAFDLWQSPWLNTNFANGIPCRDGNPIFSCICPSRRVGIRVIQLPPSENPRELYFWTDTFAKGEPEWVDELVISCALTQVTLYDAVDLMNQWISEGKVRVYRENYASLFRIQPGARRASRELALAAG